MAKPRFGEDMRQHATTAALARSHAASLMPITFVRRDFSTYRLLSIKIAQTVYSYEYVGALQRG